MLDMPWFKQPIGELDTPRLRRLADAAGAEGLGVHLVVKTELYRAACEGVELTVQDLAKSVQRYCGIGPKKAKNLLKTAEDSGVFRAKNDGFVQPIAYNPQEDADRYREVSEQRRRAAKAGRWKQQSTGGQL